MTVHRQESILAAGFALFSVLSSFVFIYYGIGILSSETSSQWLTAFAYVTAGYGLANIYVLSWAWRSRAAWAPGAIKLFALSFLGVLILDAYRRGLGSSLELIVLLGVAGVLGINWLAVKKAIHRST
jgi:hypothetical protein